MLLVFRFRFACLSRPANQQFVQLQEKNTLQRDLQAKRQYHRTIPNHVIRSGIQIDINFEYLLRAH